MCFCQNTQYRKVPFLAGGLAPLPALLHFVLEEGNLQSMVAEKKRIQAVDLTEKDYENYCLLTM